MSGGRRPLIVIALGGNALLRRGEPMDADHQRRNVDSAADAIAAIADRFRIVVTHGNGPQVGLLALQAEAYTGTTPYPLDVLGAESEGMIGYLVAQALGNRLGGAPVATLLTQVAVDPGDPAFSEPSKPIGPVYTRVEAARLAVERGWTVAPDGSSFRRVVPSPEPREVIELATIRLLLDAGVIVICAGGGGIPVVADAAGRLHGVEGVIDKDLSAALLAGLLRADVLAMVTDVDAVVEGWGTPDARPISRICPKELRQMQFAPGSMAPKIEAACRFVDATGRTAAIGSLAELSGLVDGRSGTIVTPAEAAVEA